MSWLDEAWAAVWRRRSGRAALIALAAIVAMNNLGTAINNKFTGVSQTLSTAS